MLKILFPLLENDWHHERCSQNGMRLKPDVPLRRWPRRLLLRLALCGRCLNLHHVNLTNVKLLIASASFGAGR